MASAGAVFLLALVVRAGALDVYVTADEGNWVERTTLFAGALARGDAAGTYLTGHPGVMTMWAGVIGMGFQRTAYLAQHLAAGTIGADQPAYFDALVHGRFILMLLTCLATAAVALLTWRLAGRTTGLLTGALLALEPFWIAHALVLHIDASLASYMSVGVLAALVYWWRGGRSGYLMLSAVCGGLALLSKTPGVFIFLFVPLIAGLALLWDPRRRLSLHGWASTAAQLVVWLALAVVTMLVVWPALRVDPVGTVTSMLTFTEETGGSEHENFFLNDSTGAPGALYYPITLLLRLSPVTLLGMLLMGAGLVLSLAHRDGRGLAVPLLLCVYGGLFVTMMDLAPKKFDRYLLPLYPAFVVLAALGYTRASGWLKDRIGVWPAACAIALVLAAQLWQAAATRPYFMAYYDPLFGGATTARDTIVVGWGEGMDIVARHLDGLPNADSITVSTFYNSVFAAQFRGNILSPNAYQPVSADYALMYVNVSQRSIADRLRTAIRQRDPYMSVRLNGLDYVTVYKIDDDDVGAAVPAEFGRLVRLERYRIEDASSGPGTVVRALLRWKLLGPAPQRLDTYLDLVRIDGWVAFHQRIPLGIQRPLSEWKIQDETVLDYALVIPPDLPRGRYRLITGAFDGSGTSGLRVTAEPGERSPSPAGYENGVVLATLQRD